MLIFLQALSGTALSDRLWHILSTILALGVQVAQRSSFHRAADAHARSLKEGTLHISLICGLANGEGSVVFTFGFSAAYSGPSTCLTKPGCGRLPQECHKFPISMKGDQSSLSGLSFSTKMWKCTCYEKQGLGISNLDSARGA